jgi:hypothetical protein
MRQAEVRFEPWRFLLGEGAEGAAETNTEARRCEASDLYGVLPPETAGEGSPRPVVHSRRFARSAPMPSGTDPSPHAPGDLPDGDIRAQLQRILDSQVFSRSQHLRRFLSFIVEQSLAGSGHSLKESVLANELYGKGTDFDGGTDPVVRVDARRLRDIVCGESTRTARAPNEDRPLPTSPRQLRIRRSRGRCPGNQPALRFKRSHATSTFT